jgi:uncharacterized lipoprotein YmbA
MIQSHGKLSLLVVLLALSGCSGLKYKTDYYTLIADRDARLEVGQPYSGSLGVGPVQLPEMLDHPGIVTRDNGQKLLIASYAVWAGDLNEAVTRVLADNLSHYLGSDQVWPFPWDNRVRPQQTIRVVFERFSGERGGEVELQAKWRLVSGSGEQEIFATKVQLQTEAENNSYNAYVAALNDLLNQLAKVIARDIAGENHI